MAEDVNAQRTESGVATLIARLRDEGVSAGRAQAEKLLADAQAKARTILEKAEAEANAKRDAGRKEADNFRRAGEDALKAAVRDVVLDLKEGLTRRFAEDIARAVSTATRDEGMLKEMILTVVGRARAESGIDQSTDATVLLPRTAAGLDELRRSPEELREGTLTHFAAAITGDILREGVRFGRAEDEAGGIRIVLGDRGVTVDLSDQAVADALLVHLQPRFRALLEGVVKS